VRSGKTVCGVAGGGRVMRDRPAGTDALTVGPSRPEDLVQPARRPNRSALGRRLSRSRCGRGFLSMPSAASKS